MKRLKLYIDTSVLNFLLITEDIEKTEITRELFDLIDKKEYDVFISDVVIEEMDRAPEPKRTQLVNIVNRYDFTLLEANFESDDLTQKYIQEGIIPERFINDARHIAIAVVNNMDVLVSWNFQHIVKLKTRHCVNGISKILGYKEIDICPPQEMV